MLYDDDDDDLAEAKQAYLSPPLTAITPSDQFFQNISRALRRGFESIDFDVDLDLQKSDSEDDDDDDDEEEEVPPGRGRDSVSSQELGVNLEQEEEWSVLTPSSSGPPSEPESSRRATMGDTTRPDDDNDEDNTRLVFPSVRFPSIFRNAEDMSEPSSVGRSSSSVRTVSPLLLPGRRDEVSAAVTSIVKGLEEEEEEEVVPLVRKRSRRKRGAWRRRRFVIQEKGFSEWCSKRKREITEEFSKARDFLLVVTLCFGVACAGILIIRPTIVALYGGRFDLDVEF